MWEIIQDTLKTLIGALQDDVKKKSTNNIPTTISIDSSDGRQAVMIVRLDPKTHKTNMTAIALVRGPKYRVTPSIESLTMKASDLDNQGCLRQ